MRCYPVTSPALLATGRGWGLLSPSTAAAGADSSPSAACCSPEAVAEGHGKGDSLFGSSLHRIGRRIPGGRVSRASKAAERNLEATARAMALTQERTGSPGEAGWDRHRAGALEGRGTAHMHQGCLAGVCGGGEPPQHVTQRPELCLPGAWAVHRSPQHPQQELGASRVLHSHIRAIGWGNHHVHRQLAGCTRLGSHSTDLFLGVRWDTDTRLSSNPECSRVDLHPLPHPAASSSPPCVSPSVDSAGSLMTLIIQLFSGHT